LLAEVLGVRVPALAVTVPATFTLLNEIKYLSLANCGLQTVPEFLGNIFASSFSLFLFLVTHVFCPLCLLERLSQLVELDLSGNKITELSAFYLERLTHLSLAGNKNVLDLEGLSGWLNQSNVTHLDLSLCPSLPENPSKIGLFIEETQKLQHLR